MVDLKGVIPAVVVVASLAAVAIWEVLSWIVSHLQWVG